MVISDCDCDIVDEVWEAFLLFLLLSAVSLFIKHLTVILDKHHRSECSAEKYNLQILHYSIKLYVVI